MKFLPPFRLLDVVLLHFNSGDLFFLLLLLGWLLHAQGVGERMKVERGATKRRRFTQLAVPHDHDLVIDHHGTVKHRFRPKLEGAIALGASTEPIAQHLGEGRTAEADLRLHEVVHVMDADLGTAEGAVRVSDVVLLAHAAGDGEVVIDKRLALTDVGEVDVTSGRRADVLDEVDVHFTEIRFKEKDSLQLYLIW